MKLKLEGKITLVTAGSFMTGDEIVVDGGMTRA